MIKKMFIIFGRDFLSSRRDALAIYIIVVPLILAVVIALFAPGLNDTTVNIAMLESDNALHIEYIEQYAKVEVFKNIEEVERRVNKRDEMAGIIPLGDGYEIILQGNEAELIEMYAVMLNSFYDLRLTKEETTATMISFGRTVPPLKAKLTNMLISMTIMLSGMLIAISIVEEKNDDTINAVNVTPISQMGFIIGKSLLGSSVAMISIIGAIFITGFYNVNWVMIVVIGFCSMILSLVIGFLQGINSEDFMEAAAGVKMLMLPIAGSIAGYELLSDKWQWTMYWSPFYWAYKANDLILAQTADWPTILLCTGLVVLSSAIVFILFLPRIRKGLS